MTLTVAASLVLPLGLVSAPASGSRPSVDAVASRPAEPTAALRAASGCSDVAFIAAAGSGEQKDGGSYGPTMAALREELKARLGSVSLTSTYVKYQPEDSSLGNLAAIYAVGEDAPFLRGVQRGVRGLREILFDRAKACPREVLVVGGYSQGAMVVVDVLEDLSGKVGNSIRNRIAAVALVANPYAHVEDSSQLIGNAPRNHSGIYKYVGRPARLGTNRWGGRVFEVCAKRDIVCDAAGPRDFVQQFRSGGMDIHVGYARGKESSAKAGADVKELAKRAARMVGRVPRDSTVLATLPRNAAANVQLEANGGRGEPLVWARVDGAVPAGVKVSRSGRVSGRPPALGSSTVLYDVYNPELAPDATARVEVTFEVTGTPGTRAGFVRFEDDWASGGPCLRRGDGSALCVFLNTFLEMPGPWSHVTVGGATACGIRPDQSLWCKGNNQHGQVGAGVSGGWFDNLVQVPGAWRQVSVDPRTGAGVCAVRTDGTGWCWGSPDGLTPTPDQLTPAQKPGQWTALRGSLWMGCGLTPGGGMRCWGKELDGRVSDPIEVHHSGVVGIGQPEWLDVTVESPRCGISGQHDLWCWDLSGANVTLQLLSVVKAEVGWGDWGGGMYCGLTFSSEVTCAGNDYWGTVGNGPAVSSERYTLPGRWRDVSVGDSTACGVQEDFSGWCWGRNDFGEVGDGSVEQRDIPSQVPGRWLQIRRPGESGSSSATYGLATDGTLWCWGFAGSRELCGGTTPRLLVG